MVWFDDIVEHHTGILYTVPSLTERAQEVKSAVEASKMSVISCASVVAIPEIDGGSL